MDTRVWERRSRWGVWEITKTGRSVACSGEGPGLWSLFCVRSHTRKEGRSEGGRLGHGDPKAPGMRLELIRWGKLKNANRAVTWCKGYLRSDQWGVAHNDVGNPQNGAVTSQCRGEKDWMTKKTTSKLVGHSLWPLFQKGKKNSRSRLDWSNQSQ